MELDWFAVAADEAVGVKHFRQLWLQHPAVAGPLDGSKVLLCSGIKASMAITPHLQQPSRFSTDPDREILSCPAGNGADTLPSAAM